ncbi:hypothetical protein DERP_007215 [Dermatophagoides pteronyssinus]|uniref:Uncharacterized protein n=1 Tax=Dermatophagoides pteronyssinus TaxID=6956 RepID=A0ABQ8J3R0_DERPT|nr:hypothetical protein DERP_007215 [Dermatophagoides pteronyssinus]
MNTINKHNPYVNNRQKCSRNEPIKPIIPINTINKLINVNCEPETVKCCIEFGCIKPVKKPAKPIAITAEFPAINENFKHFNELFLSIFCGFFRSMIFSMFRCSVKYEEEETNTGYT